MPTVWTDVTTNPVNNETGELMYTEDGEILFLDSNLYQSSYTSITTWTIIQT